MNNPIIKFGSLAAIAWLCAASTLFAQEPPRDGPPRGGDPGREGGQFRGGDRGRESARMNRPVGEPAGFFQQLYPPELVMRNADAIGLKPDQIEAIKKAMPLSSNEAREQQRADAKRLEQLLKNDRVDMTQALAQLDKLLQMENDFKRKQLEALIQVKNLLTPEQRSKLDSIKRGVSSPRSGEEPRFGPREGRTREDGGVH